MLPALLMPAMIGGGLGLLTNRRNPLKGALLGAGMGAAGGYLAPGLLGGATAGSGAAGGLLGDSVGAGMASMAEQQAINQAMNPGLLGTLKGYAAQAQPVLNAASSAKQALGMFGSDEQPMPAPVVQGPVQTTSLPELFASLQQAQQATQAQDDERKKRRASLLGGM